MALEQQTLSVVRWTNTQAIDAIGDYPKGTVLASGNSWGNTSTNIDLYASPDKGKTWEFVSNVARGGPPNTTNGADPIWEPFILWVCLG